VVVGWAVVGAIAVMATDYNYLRDLLSYEQVYSLAAGYLLVLVANCHS
jgi:predicted tellurium resistance membrane protein TerC